MTWRILFLRPSPGVCVVVGLFSLAVGIQAYGSTEGIRGGKGEESKFVFRQRVVRIGLVLSLYIALFFIPFFDRRGIGVFDNGSDCTLVGGGVICPGICPGFLVRAGAGETVQRRCNHPGRSPIDHRQHIPFHPPSPLPGGDCIIDGYILRISLLDWLGSQRVLPGVILFRIRDEEAVMHKEFGAEWETYCKRSWRLIPYIY